MSSVEDDLLFTNHSSTHNVDELMSYLLNDSSTERSDFSIDDLLNECQSSATRHYTLTSSSTVCTMRSASKRPATTRPATTRPATTRPATTNIVSDRTKIRRVMNVPSQQTLVYMTQPSQPGESLKELAKRQNYSVHMMKQYNPFCSLNTILPMHTCCLVWEHASHNASCFSLESHTRQPLVHDHALSQLLCKHVSYLHERLQTNVRIAKNTEFTPTHVQPLGHCDRHQDHCTVQLKCQRSFNELCNEDAELNIDWDIIAKQPEIYPAVFQNTRKNQYTFFFEKFQKNGNCKGKQVLMSDTSIQNGYVNSAGLNMDQLFYPEGTILPTRHKAKMCAIHQHPSIPIIRSSSSHENEKDNHYATMDLPANHPLFSDGLYRATGDTHNSTQALFKHDGQSWWEVGIFTRNGTLMLCTLYEELTRVVVS